MENETKKNFEENSEPRVKQKVYHGISREKLSGWIIAGLIFQIIGSISFFITVAWVISNMNKNPNSDRIIIFIFFILFIIIPIICTVLSAIALKIHSHKLAIIVMLLGFHLSLFIGFILIAVGLNNHSK